MVTLAPVFGFDLEQLDIRELLEALLDDRAKRRLSRRRKTNPALFAEYFSALKLKLAPATYDAYTLTLTKFKEYLGEFPPSEELAISFLNSFENHKQNTLVRYSNIVRGFMVWMGEDLSFRPKRTKSLPQYVEPGDVDAVIREIENKKTHKQTIQRDVLLVHFMRITGTRRSEMGHLKVRDVVLDKKVVIIRGCKGKKDIAKPLPDNVIPTLAEFIRYRKPGDSLFGLAPRTVTDKVSYFAKKAGVPIHAHSLRHHYAETLLEAGAPITDVQALLGHENLQTTSAYLGLKPDGLRASVDKMNKLIEERLKPKQGEEKWTFWVDENEKIKSRGSVSVEKIGEVLSSLFKWGKEKPD